MKCELTFSDAQMIGQDMYVSANEINALIKINLVTGEARFISSCNDGKFICAGQHRHIRRCGDELLMLPYLCQRAWGIDSYHIQTGRRRRLELPYLGKSGGRTGKFMEYMVHGDQLYIFPREPELPALILDVPSGEVRRVRNWSPVLKSLNLPFDACLLLGPDLIDGTIAIPVLNQTQVLSVDLERGACELYSRDCRIAKQLMVHSERAVYFSECRSADLYRWDRKSGALSVISGSAEIKDGLQAAYAKLICAGETVFAIPFIGSRIFYGDSDSGTLRTLEWEGEHGCFCGEDFLDANVCELPSMLYVMAPHKPCTLAIDRENRRVSVTDFQRVALSGGFDRLKDAFWKAPEAQEAIVVPPDSWLTLDRYIDMVLGKEQAEPKRADIHIGFDIHQAIMREQ